MDLQIIETPIEIPTEDSLSARPLTIETAPESHILTLESALWVLLALMAFGMRLAMLAYAPLSESEATLAYEAWRFVDGQAYEMGAGLFSPLTFNLTSLFFALFSTTDLTARLAQVFGGTALVLAPCLLRPVLGRGQALTISGLFLLSPTVLFWSRQTSGEIWAALCAVLLIAALARWWQWGREQDGWLAGLALGVGLASGAGFWSVLVAGALFLLWQWPTLREKQVGLDILRELDLHAILANVTNKQSNAKNKTRRRNSKKETQNGSASASSPTDLDLPTIMKWAALRYGKMALVVFVLAATGFFTNLQGIGAAFNLPVQWFTGIFGLGPSLVLPFFAVFLLYELLLFVTGLLGGLQLLKEQPLLAGFAFIWLGVTLIPMTISNSGWSAGLLFTVLPLALLASSLIPNLAQNLLERGSWMVDGLLILLGIGLFAYFWINLTSYLKDPQLFKLASLLIPPVAWLITAVVLSSTYAFSEIRRAIGITLLILLCLISFTNSWGLNILRTADPREPLVVQPTAPHMRTIAKQLAQISTERYRYPTKLPIGIQRTLGYAPRWYLRDFESVTLVDGSHADLPEASLLNPDLPAPSSADIGQQVWISHGWQWPISDSIGFLRWLKTRDEAPGLIEQTAVLYVRLP